MKNSVILFCAVILPLLSAPAQTTWYVATNGTGTGVGGWADATNSLPGAVAAASAGDKVRVSNGTYQLSAQLFINAAINIESLNGRGATEIRGNFPNAVFRCLYISAAAVVDGFTIANGWETNAVNGGGGVYMTAGTLRNCRVTGNYLQTPVINAQRGGAGVYMSGGTVVSNCLIDGNVLTNGSAHSAAGGGGVHMDSENAWLVDSVIYNNISTNVTTIANGKGGGIGLRNGNITGCLIVSNSASDSGGGVYMNGGKTLVSGGTNAHNFALNNGGGLNVVGALPQSGPYAFSNVVFRANTANQAGGAMYLAATSVFHKCWFEDNQAVNSYGGAGFVVSPALFYDCVFRGNQANSFGGAVWWNTTAGAGVMARCIFETNMLAGTSGKYGGGLALYAGTVLVEHSVIRGHHLMANERAYGAGVYVTAGGVTLRNCRVCDNSAVGAHALFGGRGGGLYVAASKTNMIESCTIVSNYAKLYGGGVHLEGAGGDLIRNFIVDGNLNQSGASNWYFGDAGRKTNVTYTCTPDVDITWGVGNVAGAPQFSDSTAGNYRLASGSPGINAGTNVDWMAGALDLDGRPRLDRFVRRVDMGCYEHIPQGTLYKLR